MKCPKCQFDNRQAARFYLRCGEKLELTCPQCGTIFPLSAKFCDECGHDLGQPTAVPTKVYIDDKLKIDYWDADPHPAGNFRFWVNNSYACVDNISVRPYP